MGGYRLLDSGNGKKWEQLGPYTLCRPCGQALWRPKGNVVADATFSREEGKRWEKRAGVPASWEIEVEGVSLLVAPTEFGHLGFFPEHALFWPWLRNHLQPGDRVLHLFAYSGGATIAMAQAQARVCHVDAAKGMVDWARENAKRNNLEAAPIRWIVEDARKFLRREKSRGSLYEAIVLDPPTFGRGNKGEVFSIEEEILPLLEMCREVLSPTKKFLLFTCHTPGWTPQMLRSLLGSLFKGKIEVGEMLLEPLEGGAAIPSGTFGRVLYAKDL